MSLINSTTSSGPSTDPYTALLHPLNTVVQLEYQHQTKAFHSLPVLDPLT